STNEGLSASSISSVLALRNGSVWIGNEEAIDVLEGDRVSSIATGHGLPGQDVGAMLEDHAGRIWVGRGHRVVPYHGGHFVEARKPDGSPLGNVGYAIAFTEDAAGDVWALLFASGERRLVRFSDQVLVQTIALEPPLRRPRYLANDGESGVWISAG